jgi:NAD(P)H-dependent flavin oxidoreductase YrpB (nitropropane dioxygenase family)
MLDQHVPRALDAGVDLICAQGGEGGGHTGSIPFSLLIPACVDACRGRTSPLTGKPVHVLAAGGVYDGRGLAAALMYGAAGVWVGTRFVAAEEAGAPRLHKQAVTSAGYDDTIRTIIFTGRPLRVRRTAYAEEWETKRQAEIVELTSRGKIPVEKDLEDHPEKSMEARPWLMGQVAGAIPSVKPAKEIVDDMVKGAVEALSGGAGFVKGKAKL